MLQRTGAVGTSSTPCRPILLACHHVDMTPNNIRSGDPNKRSEEVRATLFVGLIGIMLRFLSGHSNMLKWRRQECSTSKPLKHQYSNVVNS